MLEFMDSVAINAVEDKLKMGLDRAAGAMLVARSDERGNTSTEDAELIARIFTDHHAVEVFSTDDEEEGEAFVAARRFAIPQWKPRGRYSLKTWASPYRNSRSW